MQHLDPNTKWHSQAEQMAARSERDYLGRNRYENDEAHRAAWDAKTGLGFDVGDGPVIYVGKTANRVYIGTDDPDAGARADEKALGALSDRDVTIRNH